MRRHGELERAVNEVLWDAESPCSVRDVQERLADPNLAYTTVMTVLDRLARKGLLRRERVGRAWYYSAMLSREAYVARVMLDALDGAADRDAALVHFAQGVSAEEARLLRESLSDGGAG